jgi:cobalt-zinc-cadmium efflux system outer membrane protein
VARSATYVGRSSEAWSDELLPPSSQEARPAPLAETGFIATSLEMNYVLHGNRQLRATLHAVAAKASRRSALRKHGARHSRITACLCFLVTLTGIAGAQATKISLDQALDLALDYSPSIKAARTQVDQSKAQEVTANLRPNPVLSWDSQFVPIFNPGQFSTGTLDNLQQFDIGAGYLIERGGKRKRRLDAARDQTSVTRAQVTDAERALKFNVASQFINALLAQSNLDFALEDIKSFRRTVDISEERYKAGDISQGDLLKIKLQLLQFQTDVTSAELAKVQALASLRQLVGYDSVPRDYDVVGDLEYAPVRLHVADLEVAALRERPDLRAAELGVTAAQSQVNLAKANGKQDLNVSFNYSHVSGTSSTSSFFNIPISIFNRNQGEIARTRYALDQAELNRKVAAETVLTDIKNAYEAVLSNQDVVDLYDSGYLKQAQESRDITEYAYRQGGASLLDFLDAERSYRSTQLGYRQALASHMLAVETLRQAVGTRRLP